MIVIGIILASNISYGRDVSSNTDSDTSCVLIDNLIPLKGVKKYDEVKYLQQEYIRKNYEDYRIVESIHSLPKKENNIFIQSFILENDEGKRIQIYFDATDAYNNRKSKYNKELNEIVKSLENITRTTRTDNLSREKAQELKKLADNLMKEEAMKQGKTISELTIEDRKKILESINDMLNEKSENK